MTGNIEHEKLNIPATEDAFFKKNGCIVVNLFSESSQVVTSGGYW